MRMQKEKKELAKTNSSLTLIQNIKDKKACQSPEEIEAIEMLAEGYRQEELERRAREKQEYPDFSEIT